MDNNHKGGLLLLVDDNPKNLSLLAQILEPAGYECILCLSAKEAKLALALEEPDLMLLDVMMPEQDGFSLCREIRLHPKYAKLPIVFVTAKTEGDAIMQGFDVGGSDYISKPVNAQEVLARVHHQVALKKANQEIMTKNIELENLVKELEKVSVTDALTQLYNRRYVMRQLAYEMSRFDRLRRPVSVVLGDIDHFKSINDQYGHDCGDYVLRELAEMMQASMRTGDTVARWGGEEFLIVLPDTDPQGAMVLAERMRLLIEETAFQYTKYDGYKPVNLRFSVTMTFGIAEFEAGHSIDQTIIKADSALFSGKAQGRNCVFVYTN